MAGAEDNQAILIRKLSGERPDHGGSVQDEPRRPADLTTEEVKMRNRSRSASKSPQRRPEDGNAVLI